MKTSLRKLRGLAHLRHERKEQKIRQPSDELAMAAQVFFKNFFNGFSDLFVLIWFGILVNYIQDVVFLIENEKRD